MRTAGSWKHASTGVARALAVMVALSVTACDAPSAFSPAADAPSAFSPAADARSAVSPAAEAPLAVSPTAEAAVGSGAQGGFGEGFLVWESNRARRWRIWIRDLDGDSPPRPLAPEKAGRTLCCPHISPDGRSVAYLSLGLSAGNDYPPDGGEGHLYLIAPDGTGDRMIASSARNYFENRAAVWLSSSELIYIRGDRRTVLHNLGDGSERELLRDAPGSRGWLINSRLSHATTGEPIFAPFDSSTGTIAVRTPFGGCQPYFSHDGRWGFWVAGAGGPINRIDLASGAVSAILAKSDRRAPDGLGYAYYPMFSADGRLFAYAASTGDHHHFRADYEVLVSESDPRTLELIGEPIRMTHHPATDRFPDIFLSPLDLGRHYGEAPFSITFAPAGDRDDWRFDFGDGTASSGPRAEHTYRAPGRYAVRAHGGEEVLRGQVVVSAPAPPRPVTVSVEEERRVIVRFDEEIAASEARLELDSGAEIEAWSVAADRRSLVLDLAEKLESSDLLRVAGISDRAQQPNELPPTELEIEPPLWPSEREGLVFLWKSGDSANLILDPTIETERACTVGARGEAHFDRNFAMVLARGSYEAAPSDASYIRHSCQATNELAVEAVLTPGEGHTEGLRPIVSFSGAERDTNFILGQLGDKLVFSLSLTDVGVQTRPVLELAQATAGRPNHVLLTYRPGQLVAYLDGEAVLDTRSPQGDFFVWGDFPLTFGGGSSGGDDWLGTLEGVAIFNRFVESPEAQQNYLRHRRERSRRAEPARLVIEATLERASAAPSLREISPYREALAIFGYRVDRVIEGEYAEPRLRVAHWSILDGRTLPIHEAAPGESRRLVLESFADNRQLESLYLSDTLPPARLPLFHAVER